MVVNDFIYKITILSYDYMSIQSSMLLRVLVGGAVFPIRGTQRLGKIRLIFYIVLRLGALWTVYIVRRRAWVVPTASFERQGWVGDVPSG